MTSALPVSLQDVQEAAERIRSIVQPSPLIRSIPLSEITGSSVYLKIESLHPPGSFKIRGAANKILSLPEGARATGVVASSAGNHGAAVAYVAGVLGIPATVCVPENVDAVKLEAIRGFGAEAIAEGENFEEALRHNSRLNHIGLGRRLTGTRVLVLVADLDVRVLSEDGELLRALTLDPTRDYQPQVR